MIDGLKPYPAYKDSGVPWLGKVPEHWEVLPGHGCFVERKQPNIGLMETTVLSLSYGRIVVKPEDKLRGLVPASFETYQIVDPGDIVCRPTDLQNDQNSLRFGLVRNRGIITSAYMTFRTTGRLDSNYGYLLLHAYDVKKIFYGLGSGLRQNLDWRDFKRLPCLVPPLLEQTAIVRFVDYMDRRIRRYIRAKQKLITLLEEYRQALIHQAVTGKIDVRTGQRYPSYKDSGVPWLGQVPEHWEMVPNRALLKKRKKLVGSRHSEYQMLSLTKRGIIVRDLTMLKGKFSADLGTSQEVRPGDLVFCLFDIPETPRTVGHSPYFGMITGAYTIFEPLGRCRGEFIERFYIAMDDRKLLAPLYTGLRNTIPPSVFLQTKTPVPPLPEQTAIVEYLDAQTAKLDAAIAAARREIELLREYRERLIADVVTGKVDVREVAAQLPEEPPEEEAELMDMDEIAEGEATDDDAAAEALPEEGVEA